MMKQSVLQDSLKVMFISTCQRHRTHKPPMPKCNARMWRYSFTACLNLWQNKLLHSFQESLHFYSILLWLHCAFPMALTLCSTLYNYHSLTKLQKGYVYICVCQSVCSHMWPLPMIPCTSTYRDPQALAMPLGSDIRWPRPETLFTLVPLRTPRC